jgi:two-component system response regulator AtoC
MSETKPPEQQATVVVIDDDPSMRTGLSYVLQQTHRPQIFENAAAALDYLREGNPADVVILDIRMEEMDGVQAYAEIRSIAPRLPIIFYTAYPLEDVSEDTKHNLQYATFLSKGCSVGELRQALKNALETT